jgi:hypothetical protein
MFYFTKTPMKSEQSENAGVFIISVAICFGSTGLLTGLKRNKQMKCKGDSAFFSFSGYD